MKLAIIVSLTLGSLIGMTAAQAAPLSGFSAVESRSATGDMVQKVNNRWWYQRHHRHDRDRDHGRG
jgi:hypothetical protein